MQMCMVRIEIIVQFVFLVSIQVVLGQQHDSGLLAPPPPTLKSPSKCYPPVDDDAMKDSVESNCEANRAALAHVR